MELIEDHQSIEPPEGVQTWDIDPYSSEVLTNPADYYQGLRSRGAFVHIPRYSILACGQYEATREVFSDHERFVSSRGVGLQDFKLKEPWRPPSIILEVDPPEHKKTRAVMMRAMSPRVVTGLKERFRDAADALVDALIEKGPFEAVADFAETYPTQVFPEAVGMRNIDRRKLVDYGAMVFNALGPDNEIRREAMAKGPQIVPWITEQCRRENLNESGIGSSIYAAADDEQITTDEAGMLVRSLLSAGIDTTVTAIGSALWCFATYPDQFELLRANPSLARPAFDEVLRYTSPVHSFCRTAATDTTVSGVRIREHTKILCVLGSANLDENYWPQADRFDISRKPVGHLALGVGVHQCVGQNIARAEGEAVLSALASKVERIEMVKPPVWRANNAIRALDQMQVRFVGH